MSIAISRRSFLAASAFAAATAAMHPLVGCSQAATSTAKAWVLKEVRWQTAKYEISNGRYTFEYDENGLVNKISQYGVDKDKYKEEPYFVWSIERDSEGRVTRAEATPSSGSGYTNVISYEFNYSGNEGQYTWECDGKSYAVSEEFYPNGAVKERRLEQIWDNQSTSGPYCESQYNESGFLISVDSYLGDSIKDGSNYSTSDYATAELTYEGSAEEPTTAHEHDTFSYETEERDWTVTLAYDTNGNLSSANFSYDDEKMNCDIEWLGLSEASDAVVNSQHTRNGRLFNRFILEQVSGEGEIKYLQLDGLA